MHAILRLYEDVLSTGAEIALPALPRLIFVVHGEGAIPDRIYRDDEVFGGEGGVVLTGGRAGATVWRWELSAGEAGDAVSGEGVVSREKLSARLDTPPQGALILRGDSVAFPPGGCAYLHRHQGPGIRCLLQGGIRIDTHGCSTSYGPGGAWYESGQEPVFAQAAERSTRFIRVMLLPAALLGKSSIEYVNDEDKAKPKTQQYKIYADIPIALGAKA